MGLPGAIKIPDSVVAARDTAQKSETKLSKEIKDARRDLDKLTAARDALAGVQNAGDVTAKIQQIQQSLPGLAAPAQTKAREAAQAELAALNQLAPDFSQHATQLQGLIDAAQQKAAEIATKQQQQAAAKATKDAIDGLSPFTKNRTGDIRAIENDLVKMRTALQTFVNSPLQPDQQCVAPMQQVVTQLTTYVDGEAHKANCHVCNTSNQLPRTQAAKDAIGAKLTALKQLADLPNADSLATDAEKADFLLAKSVKNMAQTIGEDGQTAGKMFGALICRNPNTGQLETLYAFSGVVFDQQRDIEAQIKRLQADTAKVPVPPDLAELQQKLLAAQAKLPAAVDADRAANTLLAQAGQWCPPLDPLAGTMKSRGGAQQTMAQLKLLTGGQGNSVGNCSAPRLIQQAKALGLEPVAMAEAWMGGGSNKDGELVASCTTCMTNIGFQLCLTCT